MLFMLSKGVISLPVIFQDFSWLLLHFFLCQLKLLLVFDELSVFSLETDSSVILLSVPFVLWLDKRDVCDLFPGVWFTCFFPAEETLVEGFVPCLFDFLLDFDISVTLGDDFIHDSFESEWLINGQIR